jgi:hypothetical protein
VEALYKDPNLTFSNNKPVAVGDDTVVVQRARIALR